MDGTRRDFSGAEGLLLTSAEPGAGLSALEDSMPASWAFLFWLLDALVEDFISPEAPHRRRPRSLSGLVRLAGAPSQNGPAFEKINLAGSAQRQQIQGSLNHQEVTWKKDRSAALYSRENEEGRLRAESTGTSRSPARRRSWVRPRVAPAFVSHPSVTKPATRWSDGDFPPRAKGDGCGETQCRAPARGAKMRAGARGVSRRAATVGGAGAEARGRSRACAFQG